MASVDDGPTAPHDYPNYGHFLHPLRPRWLPPGGRRPLGMGTASHYSRRLAEGTGGGVEAPGMDEMHRQNF